ncbi:hypothetical protein BHM03_00061458 [Ensete ventricosum]|nr:hypothetical protein BHM03_00061458 [Ensete ventricosum]
MHGTTQNDKGVNRARDYGYSLDLPKPSIKKRDARGEPRLACKTNSRMENLFVGSGNSDKGLEVVTRTEATRDDTATIVANAVVGELQGLLVSLEIEIEIDLGVEADAKEEVLTQQEEQQGRSESSARSHQRRGGVVKSSLRMHRVELHVLGEGGVAEGRSHRQGANWVHSAMKPEETPVAETVKAHR